MRTESLDRGKRHAEDERIEAAPRRIVDPSLIAAPGSAALAKILQGEEPAEQEADDYHRAGNDKRGAAPADHQKQHEREQQIELVFNSERPGVGERGAGTEPEVLDGPGEFPKRK